MPTIATCWDCGQESPSADAACRGCGSTTYYVES